MKLRQQPPAPTPSPAPAPPVAQPPKQPYTTLVVIGLLFVVVTGCIVALSGPTDASMPSAQTLRPGRMDPVRHVVWVRLDSLRRRLDLLAGNGGLSVRVSRNRLYVGGASDKELERLLFNGLDLRRFTQATDSPVKAEPGNGFSVPIQQRQGTAFVQVPTDIISSLLRSTESIAE